MGYTVSGVSRMIASLEDEVGFPLLSRGHRGVVPTVDCQRLLPAAEGLVLQAERCRQLAAQVHGLEIGSVTVGLCYNSYCRQLAGLIASFSREYPHIQVNVLDSQLSSDMIEALERHRVDLCFLSRRAVHGGGRTGLSPDGLTGAPLHPAGSGHYAPGAPAVRGRGAGPARPG